MATRRCCIAILIAPLLLLGSARNGSADETPTPMVDVTDTYHGVAVHDPYRWLEDADDPKVKAWTAAQNARTRADLDRLTDRDAIKARLTTLVTQASPAFYGFQADGGL